MQIHDSKNPNSLHDPFESRAVNTGSMLCSSADHVVKYYAFRDTANIKRNIVQQEKDRIAGIRARGEDQLWLSHLNLRQVLACMFARGTFNPVNTCSSLATRR